MLWFYLSALAVLVGAELNSEIEHASPYGTAPGEKVAGGKTTIGAVANRAWLEPTSAGTLNPAIARANCDAGVDVRPGQLAAPRARASATGL